MKLRKFLGGVAKWLLPFLVREGLEQYRKKNPKSGWIVDAVESALENNEQSIEFRQLSPEKKVDVVAKQVRSEFDGIELETARSIARLAVTERMAADKKHA